MNVCANALERFLSETLKWLNDISQDGTKLRDLPRSMFTFGISSFGGVGRKAFVPYLVHLTLVNRLLLSRG